MSPSPPQPPTSASVSPSSSTSQIQTANNNPPRIRRRNRLIQSCLECRRRKLKCDKAHPCINCRKFSRDCVFLAPALDQASQLKLTEIKERVGNLEALLERDVQRRVRGGAMVPGDGDGEEEEGEREGRGGGTGGDGNGADGELDDLEPSSLAVVDAAYDDDADNDDELVDLGIQLGKMRMTERIGGFFRPKIAQELEITLSDPRNRDDDESRAKQPASRSSRDTDFLKPGPTYIAPDSSFFFGNNPGQTSLLDFLPSRVAADRLVKQYFLAVDPIAKIVHRPSFEKDYDLFWDQISLGIPPSPSIQTLVFAAMFSGVVSMDESAITEIFGVAKASLVDNFRLGTETALARAHFLRTTKVQVLQSFIMYLIPLCRSEVSRVHSVLVGAAIRMAECMGLHRDGETYGLTPLEIHVRRLIWYQLCFLDIRTCEAQGPRPSIRKDDFDTKLPLNIDDAALHEGNATVVVAKEGWTDVTFSLMRFECLEMMRCIWRDRTRVEKKKMSLTSLLEKVEAFKGNMARKYDGWLDDGVPIQRAARLLKSVYHARMIVMVVHRYHSLARQNMPDRLRRLLMTASVEIIEHIIPLETHPSLHTWAWYTGAYQQFHTAFLLLAEVAVYPYRNDTRRIWAALDYVFETSAHSTPEEKGRAILMEVKEKTKVFANLRKMRVSAKTEEQISIARMNGIRGNALHGEGETRKEVELEARDVPEREAREAMGESLGEGLTSIGRAPVPNTVYAGVSNGETLWAEPHTQASPDGGSDTGSGSVGNPPAPKLPNNDDLMADIDWEAFDVLFPPGAPLMDNTAVPFDSSWDTKTYIPFRG